MGSIDDTSGPDAPLAAPNGSPRETAGAEIGRRVRTVGRVPYGALCAIACAAGIVWAATVWDYVVDDCFINFRYAQNLLDGHGLVFNAGERVEGYTNILIVLAAAACLAAGIDPVVGLKCLTVAAGLATLWLTARLERRLAGDGRIAGPRPLAPLLLVSTGAFVYWAFCPMDAMPFTALATAALVLAIREGDRGRWLGSGIAFALLALARPEGSFVFATTTIALVVTERLRTGGWMHLRRHVASTVLVGGTIAAYIAWRYVYFDTFLPNTYYAKVTGGAAQLPTGFAYLRDWAFAHPFLAVTLFLPGALAWPAARRRARAHPLPFAVALVAVVYAAAIVAIGGDFMPFHRFFVPILPICAALAAMAIGSFPWAARAARFAIPVLLLAHIGAGAVGEQRYRAFVADRTADIGERVGAWLKGRLDALDLIAVNTAGSLPYRAELPTIDMLGLTDATIAKRPVFVVSAGWAGHRRGWGAYVLERRPRVIVWYNSAGAADPFYLSDRELADDPRFRFFYRLRRVDLPFPPGMDADRPIKRFVGLPFGPGRDRPIRMADLGLIGSIRHSPVSVTTLREGPVEFTYFERDRRNDDLWAVAESARGDLRRLLDAAIIRWRADLERQSPPDAGALAAVAALCEQARGALAAGERERARALLGHAVGRNEAARSPLPYQYLANLAVLGGRLPEAVDAQIEALRVDPGNQRFRENLRYLLTVSWAEFHQPGQTPRTESPSQ
jgi:hypothetical protein